MVSEDCVTAAAAPAGRAGWNPRDFGAFALELRNRSGLSHRKAASALATNTGTLWRVEKGQLRRPPAPELLLLMSEVYQVDLWDLLELSGVKPGRLEAAWEARYGLAVKDFWRTPSDVFAHYDACHRFRVDLAALPAHSLAPRCITPDQDALSDRADWLAAAGLEEGERGAGWLNPPYSTQGGGGRGLLAWTERVVREYRRGLDVCFLVPPSMATQYMQLAWSHALSLDFFRHRLNFRHPVTGKLMKGNRGESCVLTFSRDHDGGGPQVRYVDLERG